MTGRSATAIARWEPTGIPEVDSAVARWRPATMVPAQFLDRDGHVKVADLGLAALVLWDLEVPPRINIPFVYVIKGRVGLMATLQRALAARAGWDLQEAKTGPSACTWRIRRMGCCDLPDDDCPHWRSYTVTMEMAERAGWTKRARADEPSMYEKMPEAMLSARACTWLLDRTAPGVKLGIVTALAPRGVQLVDETSAAASVMGGEARSVAAPRPEFRDDGSTIPEALRQPPAPEDMRLALVDRLAQLELSVPERVAELRARIGPARIPNLHAGGAEFKLAHAMLLDLLFAEVERDVSAPDVSPVSPPAADFQEPTPTHVVDAAPEARGFDEEAQSTSYEDPGRPFE